MPQQTKNSLTFDTCPKCGSNNMKAGENMEKCGECGFIHLNSDMEREPCVI